MHACKEDSKSHQAPEDKTCMVLSVRVRKADIYRHGTQKSEVKPP